MDPCLGESLQSLLDLSLRVAPVRCSVLKLEDFSGGTVVGFDEVPDPFSSEVSFHFAQAWFQRDKVEESWAILQELSKGRGEYAKRARQLLDDLPAP